MVTRQINELLLHCFVKEGHIEGIEPLAKAGVNINLKTPDGTLMMTAAQKSNWDIFELLINLGVDVYATNDYYKNTILHHAASSLSWLPVTQLFVKRKFNLNVINANKETALMIAVRCNKREMVELLVHGGADLNCCDAMNWTVLHYAVSKRYLQIAKFLVENGVNTNIQNVKGQTALHLLLRYRGDIGFVCFLLRSGADPKLEDKEGYSAFNLLAPRENNLEAIKLCIQKGAYVKPVDYSAFVMSRLLRNIVLKSRRCCVQAIINKYNSKDLPDVYKAVSSDALPRIDNFKIERNSKYEKDLDMSVTRDIHNRGHCNLLEMRPLVLKMMCVDSILTHIRAVEKSKAAAIQPKPSISESQKPAKRRCFRNSD